MTLRLAFLGTSGFAVPSLRACAAHFDVAAVVTQPDKPGDRGKRAPRPVADAAADLGLPVRAPVRIRDPIAIDEILELELDVLVVAAYGQILPVRLLEQPRFGGVNVHASLLPRWRGASPIANAIRWGDAVTGVSIMKMEQGLDTGPVYAMHDVAVGPRATTPELTAELAAVGAAALVAVLGDFAEGHAPLAVPQDDAQATVAPRLNRGDGAVDWERHSALDVDRMIRAFQPWPGVTATVAGMEVRLLAAAVAPGEATEGTAPGSIVGNHGGDIEIATVAGIIRVAEVQPPGKKRMGAADYLRGRR